MMWMEKHSALIIVKRIVGNLRVRFRAPKTFSQTGEDALAKIFLPEKRGQYLDIGSGHPVRGNNTYMFYRSGYQGILIDPIKLNQKISKVIRPRDKFIRSLVGNSERIDHFWILDPYQYSTTDENRAADLLKSEVAKLVAIDPMEVKTVGGLGISFSHKNPTLLSIDVEGLDVEVLEGIDWAICHPRVIIIEEHIETRSDFETPIWKLLTKNRYAKVAWTGLSSIFVAQEYLDEIEMNR
jgi:hypothetical protein